MSEITLITGGARSGKSRLAERLAEAFDAPRGYIATGEARDAEMDRRIARHRARRGPQWQTVEEPLELVRALKAQDGRCTVILVDCVTLWISNLMFAPAGAEAVLPRVAGLIEAFDRLVTPVLLVTNEVGMGIVPEHPLARQFRDLAGEANEMIAERADRVYLTVSGLPLKLKG